MTAVYSFCTLACEVAGTIGSGEGKANDQNPFALVFGWFLHSQAMDNLAGEPVKALDIWPVQLQVNACGKNDPVK